MDQLTREWMTELCRLEEMDASRAEYLRADYEDLVLIEGESDDV